MLLAMGTSTMVVVVAAAEAEAVVAVAMVHMAMEEVVAEATIRILAVTAADTTEEEGK